MRDEIIKFFTDKTLKPEDILFFYFSGHGYLDKNKGRTFLSTSEIDAEWPEMKAIPFHELTNYLNYSNSERIVAVLDCCFSGALELTSGKGGEEEEESAKAEKGDDMASHANANMARTMERLIRSGQGKCILASSLEEQKSFKMQDEPYSLFTYYLIQGLKGANGESVDSNGYVTPELLGSYVNKKIYELPTIKQKPIRKIEVTGQIILAHYPTLAKSQQYTSQKDYLLNLLKEGKISEFNEVRNKDNYSRVNFDGVDLSGRDLSHADLRNLDLNLANLRGTKLSRVLLVESGLFGGRLEDTDLSGANLSNAILSQANLSNAILSQANLQHSQLSNAYISQAILSNSDLSGANLSNAILSHTNLLGANLSGAKLSKVNLWRAILSYANLSGANLSDANLWWTNLSGAILSNSDLSNSDLSNSDLSNSDLSGANLSNAILSHTNLSNANVASAIMIGLQFSDKSYLLCKNAKFDDATIIDDKEVWRHFNNNANSVPPTVKDKKELKKKLEKRGIDKETIDRYLTLSSLPDSS